MSAAAATTAIEYCWIPVRMAESAADGTIHNVNKFYLNSAVLKHQDA